MNKLLKTGVVYLGISLFALLFSYIYSLYSHGMSSASMSYLFLVPFILGCCVYLIIYFIDEDMAERPLFRLFYNIYNTAVAILAARQLLNGIFVIAGSSSKLLKYYYIAAGILFIAAFIVFGRIIRNKNKISGD